MVTGGATSPLLALLFALATALCNALAVTSQHVGSRRGAAGRAGWARLVRIVRDPLWLVGWVALAGSLIFQSLALHFGPMAEVQPVLVLELAMALMFRRLWFGQKVRVVTWFAGVVTIAGLVTFLLCANPVSRTSTAYQSPWLTVSIVSAAAVGILSLLGSRGTPGRRAALFASATALAWAVEAAFIKAATDVIAKGGYWSLLHHWPTVAVILCGGVGLATEQVALHVGPLSVSQPFIVILDPLVSVALGVWLFEERLNESPWRLGLAIASFALMALSARLLLSTSNKEMNDFAPKR